jgi:hypothetical protein
VLPELEIEGDHEPPVTGEPRDMTPDPLRRWHDAVRLQDVGALDALLADDAVFHSPIVHTPQRGKALAARYLSAALRVLANPTFRYVRELVGPSDALLEFEVELDGIHVNGVDLIRWNQDGRISDFKVMIRPLKAIQAVQERMAAALNA